MVPPNRKITWRHWHYAAGVLVFVLLLERIGFSSSKSGFDFVMSTLLVIVIAFEIIGWVTKYILTRRLSSLPEEMIFSRINGCREQLKRKVESRLLETVKLAKSNTLADYYIEHLAKYFAQSRHLLAHIKGDSRPCLRIRRHLQKNAPRFNQAELAFVEELEEYIKQKDSLDVHLAVNGFLECWSWLHAPLTLFLFALAAVNLMLFIA